MPAEKGDRAAGNPMPGDPSAASGNADLRRSVEPGPSSPPSVADQVAAARRRAQDGRAQDGRQVGLFDRRETSPDAHAMLSQDDDPADDRTPDTPSPQEPGPDDAGKRSEPAEIAASPGSETVAIVAEVRREWRFQKFAERNAVPDADADEGAADVADPVTRAGGDPAPSDPTGSEVASESGGRGRTKANDLISSLARKAAVAGGAARRRRKRRPYRSSAQSDPAAILGPSGGASGAVERTDDGKEDGDTPVARRAGGKQEEQAVAQLAVPVATPDGKTFRRGAVGVPLAIFAKFGRAIGKRVWFVIVAVWRFFGALDSALWRGFVRIFAIAWAYFAAAAEFLADSVGDLVRWLPSPVGRAYCAGAAAVGVIASLWIFDELRGASGAMVDRELIVLPPDVAGDPIVARVAGRFVRLSDVRASFEAAGFLEVDEALSAAEAFERGLVESYIEQRLLARAARESGLQRDPAVATKLAVARDRILSGAYMKARIEEATSPERVRRLYDSQADLVRLGDEVRARHIVVGTEPEARAVLEDIAAGVEFASLARARSLDRSTGPKGGEIGYFTRQMMAPTIANAAFATPVGEIAPLFTSEFGWHVLEVLDRRPAPTVRFEDVSDEIREFLRRQAVNDALREIIENEEVLYFEPVMSSTSRRRADGPIATGVVAPVEATSVEAWDEIFGPEEEQAPALRDGEYLGLDASGKETSDAVDEPGEGDPEL